MENNVIEMKNFDRGLKAGFAAVQSKAMDQKKLEENLAKIGEWANEVDLEPTAGNVWVVSTIAVMRTILGDELFDRSVVDENGDFSDEAMEMARDQALAFLGFRLNDDGEVVELHKELTAE